MRTITKQINNSQEMFTELIKQINKYTGNENIEKKNTWRLYLGVAKFAA